MQNKSDAELIRDYAENGAEAALAEIVARHTGLVYSAALRRLGSPDAAEEARNACSSAWRKDRGDYPGGSRRARIAGRLAVPHARNVSLNHRRDEFRRQSRERLAMQDLATPREEKPDWESLCAVLDDAMSAI